VPWVRLIGAADLPGRFRTSVAVATTGKTLAGQRAGRATARSAAVRTTTARALSLIHI